MSLLEECVLAGEPDIYGIGVRIAVYAQNLLAFIPAFWALKDGEVSRSELGALETQSTTILITAFAVLFSAIVQGLTHQINMFHAFIVLELSWMNNTNTFIWFFLYIHHVGWEKGIKSLNPLSWRFWIFHEDEYDGQMLAGETIPEKMKTLYRQNSLGRWPRFVIILGTLHLSLMGAIGIWLWSDPHKFGAPIPCNIAYRLSFAVLGTRVPLFAAGTRILSLLIYLAVLIPVLNIVLPVFFAITVYRWSNKDAEQRDADNRITTTRPGSTYAALILLFAMNVAFVCDIEVTIRRNAIFQNDKDEMTPWTFGQTLALLLLAIPLRDTVVMALTWSDGRPMIRVAQDSLLPLLEGNSHLMARQLIHDGVDPNLCNLKSSRFKCALQLAVHNDDAETIRMYAKRRVEFSVKKGGLYGTAFEDALARGRSKVLHAMMALYEDHLDNRTSKIEARDTALLKIYKSLNTAGDTSQFILEATSFGSVALVKHIVDRKIPMNALIDKGDAKGDSILHIAAKNNHKDILLFVLFLIDRCTVDAKDRKPLQFEPRFSLNDPISDMMGVEMITLPLKKHLPNIFHLNNRKETALSHASEQSDTSLASLLVEYLGSRNYTDKDGNTALHIEAKEGHAKAVSLLLNGGFSVMDQNHFRETPLYLALQAQHYDVVNILLEWIAENDPKDAGASIIHRESEEGHGEAVNLLLLHRSWRRNERNIVGETPLHIVARAGYQDIVEDIIESTIENEGNLNPTDDNDCTPLHNASERGYVGIVKLFLQQPDILLNKKNNRGNTPLHLAVIFGHKRVVESLLQSDADQTLSNDNKWTPLHVAARQGNREVLAVLLGVVETPPIAPKFEREPETAAQLNSAAGSQAAGLKLSRKWKVDTNLANEDGWTSLHFAARENQFGILDLLIEQAGADPNKRNDDGDAALHIAASYGHLACVEALLKYGGNPSLPNKHGFTPLNCAIYNGHVDIVALLMKQSGVDLNHRDDDGNTLVHKAAQVGSFKSVEILLSSGLDIDANIENNDGWTPLHFTARHGYGNITDLLLHQPGVDPNKPIKKDGWTSLHLAASNGHESVVQALFASHADLNIPNDQQCSALHLAARNGRQNIVELLIAQSSIDLDQQDGDGDTALHEAARNGHATIVELLLKHKARACLLNKASLSPLHYAAREGREKTLGLFFNRPGVDVNCKGQDGDTPLHEAAWKGHAPIVRLLFKANADPSRKNELGLTPLHCAAREGHKSIVKLLLERNDIVVDEQEVDGDAAIHEAAWMGHTNIIEKLLASGADPNIANGNGWTPLHYAARQGLTATVNKLLEQKQVDPNKQKNDGWTALHLAVSNRHTTTVEALLKANSDITLKNQDGYTALQIARATNDTGVVEILERYIGNL